MKHLLFILDYYSPHRGGIENVFENIISRLLKKGYQISLITSRFDAGLKKEEKIGNLKIYRVGKGRKDFFFKGFWKGVEVLRKHKNIEVIHSSTYTSAIPASILGFLFGKKSILTVHEIFGKLWKVFKPRYSRRIYQLFERLSFMFKHDIYHCVSLYTLNSIRLYYGIPDEKLHLIYNGVDTDFWDAGKVGEKVKKQWRKKFGWEHKFLMLYYGHSGMSKGIDYLVEAIPEIVKENSDGVLIFNLIPAKRDREMKERILGYSCASRHSEERGKALAEPNDEESRYTNISIETDNTSTSKIINTRDSSLPLRSALNDDTSRVIIFNGREKEQLRELIATADVVIAPSLAEGFGSVHSETCAMGKTLITTQVAAIPEVVSGNVKFVQPCSSEAIVQGIREVRKGKSVRIAKKEFDRDESVKKVEELYK